MWNCTRFISLLAFLLHVRQALQKEQAAVRASILGKGSRNTVFPSSKLLSSTVHVTSENSTILSQETRQLDQAACAAITGVNCDRPHRGKAAASSRRCTQGFDTKQPPSSVGRQRLWCVLYHASVASMKPPLLSSASWLGGFLVPASVSLS